MRRLTLIGGALALLLTLGGVGITGGTGRYQGVGGEATLVEFPDQTGTLTVRLHR